MNLLSREELKALVEHSQGPCVSIFLPTHRAGSDVQQDPVRLKNLIREAHNRLAESGHRSGEIEGILNPASNLLPQDDFWAHQSDGLAIFASPGFFGYNRLPLSFEERVVVANSFYVKPLFPLFTGDGRLYVLAISQNNVRLLQATKHSFNEVDLDGVPRSLAEALKYDDFEKQQQLHTQTTQRPHGERSAMFHGHGSTPEVGKENILRFFREVDKGLQKRLKGQHAPLVLAAVDYLVPIFKEATDYPQVLDRAVTGNPDEAKSSELHQKAWKVVEPYFAQARQQAAEEYRRLAGSEKASQNLRDILPAAAQGRVNTLFTTLGDQQWGLFDRDTGQIEFYDEPGGKGEDLLNRAAVEAFARGATIYAVKPEEAPVTAPAAAVFRY